MKKLPFRYPAEFYNTLPLFKELPQGFIEQIAEIQSLYYLKENEELKLEPYRTENSADIWICFHGKGEVTLREERENVLLAKPLFKGVAFCNFYEVTGESRYWVIKTEGPCYLAKYIIDKEEKRWEKEYARLISRIVKNTLITHDEKREGNNYRHIAILPSHPEERLNIDEWSKKFTDIFSKMGSTLIITPNSIKEQLKCNPRESDKLTQHELAFRLIDLENRYDYSLYILNSFDKEWIEFCTINSDLILFVACGDHPVELSPIAEYYLSINRRERSPTPLYLALTYDKFPVKNSHLLEWKELLKTDREVNIRNDNSDDLSRLIRIIMQKSIALVLGSGAGRGITHIGILRALEEVKVPIDVIAGSSVGALVGALKAQGNDWKKSLALSKIFLETLGSSHLALPVLSMISETAQKELGEILFGLQNIEDFTINYFCTAVNLHNSETVIHQSGLALDKVSSSSALPGLFPPVEDNNSLLIDGGVIEPIPVEPMIELYNPAYIIAVDVTTEVETTISAKKPTDREMSFFEKLFYIEKKPQITLMDIILRMCELNGVKKRQAIVEEHLADLLIRPDLSDIPLIPNQEECEAIIDRAYRDFIDRAKELRVEIKNKIPLVE